MLILLVEDNDDDVQLTLRALKLNHVANRVDVARDSAEAMDYLSSSRRRRRVACRHACSSSRSPSR